MKALRSRRLTLGGLALFAVLLGVVFGGQALRQHYVPVASAGPGVHLAIDADVTNGSRPCDPIDAEATVAVGSVHKVGLCIVEYEANSIEAFDLQISNDSTLNFAPDPDGDEEPQHGGSVATGNLDDNPDANDGDDAGGLKLGGGWDCTGISIFPPQSQTLPIRIVCNADIVNPDKDLTADPGLLATITYNVLAAGVDTLTFDARTGLGLDSGNIDCGATGAGTDADCFGATIHKQEGGAPAPTATEAGQPTVPAGATVTPTTTPQVTGPTATATPLPPGMSRVELVAGCNPLASTHPDDTSVETIADNVEPQGIVISLWEFELGTWLGYAPQSPPEANNLREADFLDVVFVCVSDVGGFLRPVV